MVPDGFFSAYKRYKEDTSIFGTWLSTQAVSCGYKEVNMTKAQVGSSTRLKGNARQAAKTQAGGPGAKSMDTHKVSTRHMLLLAQIIVVHRPFVKVPSHIQLSLLRAIQARKRCATLYLSNANGGGIAEDSSYAAHQHFIEILEQCFTILQPRFEILRADKSENSGTRPSFTTQTQQMGSSQNRFEKLPLKSTSEIDLDDSPIDTTASPSLRTTSTLKSDVYVPELPAQAEFHFAVYCFYEDLHATQEFLKRQWQDVRDGLLSDTVAAVVTHVALELVGIAEVELLKMSQGKLLDPSYRDLTSIIRPVPHYKTGIIQVKQIDVEAAMARGHFESNLPITVDSEKAAMIPGEFVYLSTFLSMDKTRRFISPHAQTPMVVPAGYLFYNQPELMPETNNWATEDDLLSKILLEIRYHMHFGTNDRRAQWAAEYRLQESPAMWPIHDTITIRLRNVFGSGDIRLSDVFKARVLLDLLQIIGAKSSNAYSALKKSTAITQHHFGFSFGSEMEIKLGLAKPIREPEEMVEFYGCPATLLAAWEFASGTDIAISRNPLVECRQSMSNVYRIPDGGLWNKEHESVVSFTGTDLAKIIPSSDHTFYYNHQPVCTGLETMRLLLGANDIGISVSNNFHSFVSVAHLYNAIRQIRVLNGQWDAMEKAITTHISQLFRGKVPVDQQHIYTRFCLCVGYPAKAFARTDTAEALLHHVDKEVKYQTKERVSKRRVHDRFDYLSKLRTCLEQSLPLLLTEFMPLSTKCNKFLQLLQAAFMEKLNFKNDITNLCGDALKECHLFMTLQTLQYDKMLDIACEVMNGFLEEANLEDDIEPLDVIAATDRSLECMGVWMDMSESERKAIQVETQEHKDRKWKLGIETVEGIDAPPAHDSEAQEGVMNND
ncbi:hypothetical protein DL98DRAFT_533306 [Cadophora sp. DSE1049]|nr:hypothetical protein DL98DRAFT_533306 [Cadophora sp. DSE1049]